MREEILLPLYLSVDDKSSTALKLKEINYCSVLQNW